MKKLSFALVAAAALWALLAAAQAAPPAPAIAAQPTVRPAATNPAPTSTAPAAPGAAAPSSTAEDPEATRMVEGAGAIVDGNRAGAKKPALNAARRAALREYLELHVPAGVLKAKAAAVDKILADSEKLTESSQELGTREESGKLVIKFKIKLRPAEIKSRMASAGLLPAGQLPAVFVLVRGVGLGDSFRSGWEPNPPESGENECEAALAAELTRYGFTITPPKSGQADTARILSPGNEAERAEVFRSVKEKFDSEMMVVGVVSAEGERIKLRLAAADTGKEKLLWSGNRERVAANAEPRSRSEAITALCRAAGEEAVTALYQSRLPSLTPGAERDLVLTVKGIDRWAAAKELEKRLRTEVPGVLGLSLTRMSPGVIEYQVRTALSSKSLADWIAANWFGGMAMKVEETDDYQITVQAKFDPNAPVTPPPGTRPGQPAAPGARPGATPPKPGTTAPATRPGGAPLTTPPASAPTGAPTGASSTAPKPSTPPKPAAAPAPKPSSAPAGRPTPSTPPAAPARPK